MDREHIIYILVLILCVIIAWLIWRKNHDKKDSDKNTAKGTEIGGTKPEDLPQEEKIPYLSGNYIAPQDFSVGLMKPEQYQSSNMCNHKVLWPFREPEVNYGWKMPDCPCAQFVRAP